MNREALAIRLAVGFVGLVLVLGLWATGGPLQGRAERRDRQRQQDLTEMAKWIDCLSILPAGLPETLTPTQACPFTGNLNDPLTGQPYAYRKNTGNAYLLCAQFETGRLLPEFPRTLQRRMMAAGFNRETGCLNLRPGQP